MHKVLVVEDNSQLRQLMVNLLAENGLTVVTAIDGVEALSQVQVTQPDLVVLDVVMPRMNGFEVCRELKSDPVTQALPVILCTAKSDEIDQYWGIKQGADAYLKKPVQPSELLSTVQHLLSA